MEINPRDNQDTLREFSKYPILYKRVIQMYLEWVSTQVRNSDNHIKNK